MDYLRDFASILIGIALLMVAVYLVMDYIDYRKQKKEHDLIKKIKKRY